MSSKNSLTKNALKKLKTEGFLLVGISKRGRESLQATFDAASAFFQEAPEKKLPNRLPKDLGYRPFGLEYSQSPALPDQVESFTVSRRAPTLISDLPSVGARVLCERMLTTFDILEPIAEAITIELSNKLSGRPMTRKLRGALRHWSLLQLNYSRPTEVSLPFINEPHEDGALLTVAYANGPGLELQMKDGEFIPMTNASENVLVLPGEIAWLLSGGQIQPLYHRVRTERSCSERMSLLFFGDIDPHYCEPWIKNEINVNVDIGSHVLKNPKRFGLEEWTPDW